MNTESRFSRRFQRFSSVGAVGSGTARPDEHWNQKRRRIRKRVLVSAV